jgi:hypothetical protein
MPVSRTLLLSLLLAAGASAESTGAKDPVHALLDRTDLADERRRFVEISSKDLKQPIITRPQSVAELLAKYRWSMKYTEKPAHKANLNDEEWERFALSLSDANLNGKLAEKLPRMATAYRISRDERFADHVRAQLKEMSQWTPLERAGTVSTRKNMNRSPWLGTGWAIRAITETLDIMPEESIPGDLKQALLVQLEAEIEGIRQTWSEQRVWYVREDSAYSNQWVVPTEGLVLASIFTGLDKHRDDFKTGVDRLVKSLDAQGKHGEFAEGVSYAGLTMNSLLSAAEAAAKQGDRRLIDHPYLKKFPTWYVHHLQPGGRIINAFDSKVEDLDPSLLARFVSSIRSPEALWAIRRNGKPDYGIKLPGLIARATPDYEPKEPPLFGKYDFAARINWRNSWDDATSSGFWMRGGNAGDAHDHEDRGHISFSVNGREILIEAGIASYGIPEHPTHYRSVAGHNVLQVGKLPPAELTRTALTRAGQILDTAHRAAPITVERMDGKGGAASVDVSGCYAATEKWLRRVKWDVAQVEVRDEVVLKAPDFITFRWHLATSPDVPPVSSDGKIVMGGIEVSFHADSPVEASVESMPGFDPSKNAVVPHACLVIRTKAPVKELELHSSIRTDH